MFEIDPDKPNVPVLARILSGMSLLCLIASVTSGMLSFSGYEWVNEIYAMAGAVAGFLFALMFAGQAKILELLAVVAARSKSRFAIDALAKSAMPAASGTPAPVVNRITAPLKERVIHVSDEQARQQGFKVK
jgi:hypothetical protein